MDFGKEYALLEYMMRNKGRIITQTMIIEHVWDMNQETASNVVSVFINHLREKIDKDSDMKLIHTIRDTMNSLEMKHKNYPEKFTIV